MKQVLKSVLPQNIINILTSKGIEYRLSTSVSDNQVYPDFCTKASIDIKLFSNFRRNKIYKEILEHVTPAQGLEYLNEIGQSNHILNHLDQFKLNDQWGNPELAEYNRIGKISPSTLRYIKVYSDLHKYFGNLDNFKIAEIGVGYGGQCRIINSIASPSEYTLIDIKGALMLAQKYLDNYILNSVMKYKTMNELEEQSYDLLISNYSFTELPRNIQDVYLRKVILKSNKGYITYNECTPIEFRSYKKEELLKIIPGSKSIDEKPLTAANNCIIVWG